jgi:hypothetical protein
MATVQEKALYVLWFFETKSVIEMQLPYSTQYGKYPPSDNAIRRWLPRFQGTDNVLHRKGAGRPSTWQADVVRIQEAFSQSPKNQIYGLLCSQIYHKRLFARLFITAFILKIIKLFELHFHIVSSFILLFPI